METSELLRKVKRLELKTRLITSQLFSGDYHSAFRGQGMSFSEVRAYAYGDDVRHIDWNVTARTGVPHLKIFEEERELQVMLLIDVSASGAVGTATQLRKEWMAEIAAVLGFSATGNNDKIGVLCFSDQVELFIPPGKGRKHLLRIIRELLQLEPKSRFTNIQVALEYLSRVIKKHGICFLLSDFKTSGYSRALHLAAKKHDVIGLMLEDPMEKQLPDLGLVPVRDTETGIYHWMDTSEPLVRQ